MDKLFRLFAENEVDFEDLPGVEIEKIVTVLEDLEILDSADDEKACYDSDDDENEEKNDYSSEFRPPRAQDYMERPENVKENEYQDFAVLKHFEHADERADLGLKTQKETTELPPYLSPAEEFEDVEYRNTMFQAYSEGTVKDARQITHQDSLLNIEYERPELINGQKTYQRIVFEADTDGETVYDMTMRKLKLAGMEVSASYDQDFGTMLITSMNQRSEGTDGNFNEFYKNGEIGRNAVDREGLKKGDIIEWRYAEETDGSCGGVPDYNVIKNLLQQYNAVTNNGYIQEAATPFTPAIFQIQYGRAA